MSKQKNGEKNGAHYILSKKYLNDNISSKDITVIDNCTNIHYKSDILKAEEYLKKMKKIVNTLDVSKIDNFSKIFDNIALLVNIEPKEKQFFKK